MAMTLRRVWLCVLLIGVAPPLVRAQTPLSLTLDDAIARGVEQAPRLADARAREAAAQSTVASRSAAGVPSVNVLSSYLRTNHIVPFGIFEQPNGISRILFPDIPNNYRVRSEVDVPVYTAGRVSNSVDAAQADARAAGADLRTTDQDVRLDVVRAYWALVTSREAVTVLEESVQRMDTWVEDVRARVETGILPPNDLQSAQAQRAHQNVQLIQARNFAALSQIQLARLIGAPLDQAIVVSTPVDQPIPSAAEAARQPIDALVKRALGERGERASLQEHQASLRSVAAASLASTRPQVGALASVEPARPNQLFVPRQDTWQTSWNLGVNFTWPLWDGGRARADYAASMAQAEAVGHRLDDFDAGVAVEIRQRLLALQSNQAALEASADAISSATEARRVVGERFNAGVATSTDVLDAQVALLQAELERTQILAALRLGEAELLRAIGEL